jgi:hypothetical protein
MAISLHTATVRTYLQILPPLGRLVDKAEAHCRENGLPDEALTDARLADDMWGFAKQIFECGRHSARAIKSAQTGAAAPDLDPVPLDFAALRAEVSASIVFLKTVDADALESLVGKEVRFEFSTSRMDFTVEDFLLSFALPNFLFHATTAYGILRNRGLPIGKYDFLGKLRLKSPDPFAAPPAPAGAS